MITDNDEDVNNLESMKQIEKNTKEWFQDWSEKDLSYISFYHDSFKHKGRRLSSYKRYKNIC